MKLSAVLFFLAIGGIDRVTGQEMCPIQNVCLDFSTTAVGPAICSGRSYCAFKICAKLSFSFPCLISRLATFGSCVKQTVNPCKDYTAFTSPDYQFGSFLDGDQLCQIVRGGETAEFLFSDGNQCSSSFTSEDGAISCTVRPQTIPSCTGLGFPECYWRVKAPDCPVPDPVSLPGPPSGLPPGVRGDPHFNTRDGTFFSYHGECDLVMAHSPTFASGLGLDVHARTKIVTDWSLVSNAAVRIGSDIFELSNDGVHYFNGVSNAQMPVVMGGRFLLTQKQSPVQFKVDGDKLANLYTIHLDHNESISITQNMMMITVTLNTELGATVGMLGSSAKAGMVGRDGETVFDDPNRMGQEWQVNDKEPMLFHDIRAPQFPEKCQLPSATSRRRLKKSSELKSMAKEACAKVLGPMNLFCVEDVLATGNVNYAYGYTAEVF